MRNRIVVAGVASLAIQVGVEDFPVQYTAVQTPRWVEVGLGGAGANIGAILARLGDDVALSSLVGMDAVGRLIRGKLLAYGLHGPGIVTSGGSSQAVVLVAADGRRIVYPHLAPIEGLDYPEAVFAETAVDARLIVLTGAQFARRLVPAAVRLGVPIAADLNVVSDCEQPEIRPVLEASEVIFCSHEWLPCAPALWISTLMTRYPGLQLVTVGCGGRGSILGMRNGRLARVESAAPLGVVSTSSAGDSIFATFLHYWLRTRDPVAALRRATLYAGWRVGHRDPGTALLTAEELDRLWRRHPVSVQLGRWT